jgi:hypothetical protein
MPVAVLPVAALPVAVAQQFAARDAVRRRDGVREPRDARLADGGARPAVR